MRDYFASFFPVDFGLYRLMSDEPLKELVRDFWPLRRASLLLALLAEVEADRPVFESFARELGGRLNSDGATLSSTLSELIALRRFHWTPGWIATRPVESGKPDLLLVRDRLILPVEVKNIQGLDGWPQSVHQALAERLGAVDAQVRSFLDGGSSMALEVADLDRAVRSDSTRLLLGEFSDALRTGRGGELVKVLWREGPGSTWDAKERAARSEVRFNALMRTFPGPRANFVMVATRHAAKTRNAGRAFEAKAWKEAKEAFEQVGNGQPVSLFFTYDFASLTFLRSEADRQAWTARLQHYHARAVAEMAKPEHATTRAGLQHFLGLAHLPSQPGLFAGDHVEFWPPGGRLGPEGIRAVQDGPSTTLAVRADHLGGHFDRLQQILRSARPGF